MKYLSVCLVCIAALYACNNNERTADTTTAPDTAQHAVEPAPAPATQQFCFAKINKNDTVQLRLTFSDTAVTGSLLYKLRGKDANKGTLQGVKHGDTLIANYTFQAEGTTSIREVAYLIKDSTATEGFGPVAEKNGQMVFTDRSKLKFGKGLVLKQITCGDIAQ